MTWQPWAADLTDFGALAVGPWDYVTLAGNIVPGTASVKVDLDGGWDTQKPKGVKRAYNVDNGDQPAKVSISLELTPTEARQFRDIIVPILRPRNATGGRAPLTIEHPMCEFWGITNIIVNSISSPPPKSGGTMVLTLSCGEYSEKPKQNKRKSSKELNDEAIQGNPVFDPYSPSGADAIPSRDDLLEGLG